MTDDRPGSSACDECPKPRHADGYDDEAVVQASLDGALEDLLSAAVETGPEPYAVSCARIDRAFDDRMAAHRHMTWARLLAEGLKMQLKLGLHKQMSSSDTACETYSLKATAAGAPCL